MCAAKSTSTSPPEKSQGAKAGDAALGGDEASFEEVVVTDPGVGIASVEKVPEGVPPADAGIAPELTAQAPSATTLPDPDQAVLGLLAGGAGIAKEVLARRQRQLLSWRRLLDHLSPRRSVCDYRHDQLGMWRRLSLWR